jgi:alkylation response protein AidB-like acyl-CoA dehydrogenase
MTTVPPIPIPIPIPVGPAGAFHWTDEQHSLRQSVRGLLERRAPLTRARALADAGERHDPAVWSELNRAGLLGLIAPEDAGGSGAGLVELAVVAEEFGRVLHGGPFLSSAVLAAPALLAGGGDAWLPDVLAGARVATLAVLEADGLWSPDSIRTTARDHDGHPVLSGVKALVLDGADADLLLVAAREPAGVSLFVVDGATGVTRTPLTALDQTRPMARVAFADAPARRLGSPGAGWDAVGQALRVGRVWLAGEQVGSSTRAVEITAEYARTRRQFGRPIGSFQGVKHRLADMAVRTELARSAAYWAAWNPSSTAVAIAASYCSESFLQTAKDMIQLHGGIGFTWEHDAHLFLRRARSTYSLLGTPPTHRAGLFGALREEAAG